MNIPIDPWMLLSYTNTKLRDQYCTLEEMCKSLCIDQQELEQKMANIDYEYNEELNKFM